jgi:broad specificity phosphatase PhoE
VLPALERLVAAHPASRVLVVSHVTPMKIMLLQALLAPQVAFRRIHLGVACLCDIDWYRDGTGVVHTLGDTAHLEPAEYSAGTYADTHGGRAGRAVAPGS